MNIKAGKLDRRITIQVAVETRDGANDPILDWPDDATFKLWAMMAAQRGYETQGAQQTVRQADTVFTIRTSQRARGIFPESHRVSFKGKVYEIIGVQPSKDRNDCLELLTSSRPDGVGARGQGETSGP